jgi:hypothetical protein
MNQLVRVQMRLPILERSGVVSRPGHHHWSVAKEAADPRISAVGTEELLPPVGPGRERYWFRGANSRMKIAN